MRLLWLAGRCPWVCPTVSPGLAGRCPWVCPTASPGPVGECPWVCPTVSPGPTGGCPWVCPAPGLAGPLGLSHHVTWAGWCPGSVPQRHLGRLAGRCPWVCPTMSPGPAGRCPWVCPTASPGPLGGCPWVCPAPGLAGAPRSVPLCHLGRQVPLGLSHRVTWAGRQVPLPLSTGARGRLALPVTRSRFSWFPGCFSEEAPGILPGF